MEPLMGDASVATLEGVGGGERLATLLDNCMTLGQGCGKFPSSSSHSLSSFIPHIDTVSSLTNSERIRNRSHHQKRCKDHDAMVSARPSIASASAQLLPQPRPLGSSKPLPQLGNFNTTSQAWVIPAEVEQLICRRATACNAIDSQQPAPLLISMSSCQQRPT